MHCNRRTQLISRSNRRLLSNIETRSAIGLETGSHPWSTLRLMILPLLKVILQFFFKHLTTHLCGALGWQSVIKSGYRKNKRRKLCSLQLNAFASLSLSLWAVSLDIGNFILAAPLANNCKAQLDRGFYQAGSSVVVGTVRFAFRKWSSSWEAGKKAAKCTNYLPCQSIKIHLLCLTLFTFSMLLLLLLSRCDKCTQGARRTWKALPLCRPAVKHFTQRCSFQWKFALPLMHRLFASRLQLNNSQVFRENNFLAYILFFLFCFCRHSVNWHNLQHGSSDIDIKPASCQQDIMWCPASSSRHAWEGGAHTHTHQQQSTVAGDCI